MALLEVRGLSMAFGGLRAVQDARSDASQHGEIVGLIGPNGSGKTTVFNVISGLYRASAGRIAFDDGRDRSGRAARRTQSPRWASRAPSRTSACSTR